MKQAIFEGPNRPPYNASVFMVRIFCLVFSFCLLQGLLSAQNGRDTLIAAYFRYDSICEAGKASDNIEQVMNAGKQMAEIGARLQVDTMIMNGNLHYGQALAFLGIFDGALKIYQELLTMAEASNHCYFKVKAATLINAIHRNMHDWNNSQVFARKAKAMATACGMYGDTLLINYDLGVAMLLAGHPEEGVRFIEQNLEACRRLKVKTGIYYGINELSNIYAEAGQFEKALQIGLEVFEIPGVNISPIEQIQIKSRLAQIELELKHVANANRYNQEALASAQALHLNDYILEGLRIQADIDMAQGHFEQAARHLLRYEAAKDTIYQNEYDAKMSAMVALYDLETKQKTIDLLEKEQQVKAGQIRAQRLLLLATLLLAGLLLLLLRFRHQRKSARMREAFTHDLLKAQEEERQRLSKDLHDSVGQNILFIKNRLYRLTSEPDEQLVNSVNATLEEVRAIAKNLYPNQLEAYGLTAAVKALCELAHEASGIFISSDLQGLDEKLSKEAQINCYRIIQECINNALKHAEASAIRITSQQQPGKIELVVQDNGKGFDKNRLEHSALRSFGMINLEERMKMLRGKFELETGVDRGVKLVFSFPV